MNKCWNNTENKQICIPKNYVIGAAKCGTTFLHSILSLHPQISPQKKKELSFYERDLNKGWEFYSDEFYGDFDKLRYDNSPIYFESLTVAEKIYKAVPDAKLILMLRNPVTRTLSYFHYFFDPKNVTHRNENVNKTRQINAEGENNNNNKKNNINNMVGDYKIQSLPDCRMELEFEDLLWGEYDILLNCDLFDEEWHPLPVCFFYFILFYSYLHFI